MYTQLGLYIDGKWNHGNGGGGEEVINPATEKPLAHLPQRDQATSTPRSPPHRRASRCGRRSPPMTAAASSRRPPT